MMTMVRKANRIDTKYIHRSVEISTLFSDVDHFYTVALSMIAEMIQRDEQVFAVPVSQSSTHTFFAKWMGTVAEYFRVREAGARLRLATGRVKGFLPAAHVRPTNGLDQRRQATKDRFPM
jgi:hypothetical protein